MKLLLFIVLLAVGLWIWFGRRKSIIGIGSRNRYFKKLARDLHFACTGDEYFVQLEGVWNHAHLLIYPHNFEGPGSITLFYAETGIPFKERSWAEPNVSLGRALVQRKAGAVIGFEFSGECQIHKDVLLKILQPYSNTYPFVAVTLPSRYHLSPYVQKVLESWKSYVVLIALDAGRKPSSSQIRKALDDCTEISKSLNATIYS